MPRDSGTFKIEGLSDCLETLKELPKATQPNVLKRVLTEVARPIADDAQQLAEQHVFSGRLEESIKVGTKLSRSQRAKLSKESKVEVYVGPSPLVQAITLEFGTYRQRPFPFMRSAWSANKHQALTKIRDSLANEIMKAAQRLARKAAREAAKMGR